MGLGCGWNMGLGCGKLYVTIERHPCFFRRKNSQSAIFTARRKNSHCEVKNDTFSSDLYAYGVRNVTLQYLRPADIVVGVVITNKQNVL